jgi:hypothetical protein
MYDVDLLKNIFIVLVTHATEIYSASYALENYLKKVGSSFLVIAHSLYESSLRYSVSRHYVIGRVVREKNYGAEILRALAIPSKPAPHYIFSFAS